MDCVPSDITHKRKYAEEVEEGPEDVERAFQRYRRQLELEEDGTIVKKYNKLSTSYSSVENPNICELSKSKNAPKKNSTKTVTCTRSDKITAFKTTIISNENSHSKNFDDKSRERAKKIAENAPIDRHLTDISQLQWHKPKDKRRQVYIPVRICTEDEKIGLPLTVKQGVTYCEELRCCGHAGKYDKKFSSISNSMLSPMTDTLDESKVEMWDCYIERYENTQNDMLANKFYLQRIIDKLKKKHEQKSALKKSHREEQNDAKEGVLNPSEHQQQEDDEVEDSYDEPNTKALDVDEIVIPSTAGRKKEPIRPGDVINYHDPMLVAGDKHGIKEASIISVDSKRYPILTLSNGDILPPNTNILRVRVMKQNKLEDYPFGLFRLITDFKLNKAGKHNGKIVHGKIDMLEGTDAMVTNLSHKGHKQRINRKKKKGDNDEIERNSEVKSFLTPSSISCSSSSSADKSVSISSSGKKERNSYVIVDISDDEKPLFLSHERRTTTYRKNTNAKQQQPKSKTNIRNNMLLSSDDEDEPISVLKDTRTSNEKNMFSMPSTSRSQESAVSAIPKHKKNSTLFSTSHCKRKKEITTRTRPNDIKTPNKLYPPSFADNDTDDDALNKRKKITAAVKEDASMTLMLSSSSEKVPANRNVDQQAAPVQTPALVVVKQQQHHQRAPISAAQIVPSKPQPQQISSVPTPHIRPFKSCNNNSVSSNNLLPQPSSVVRQQRKLSSNVQQSTSLPPGSTPYQAILKREAKQRKHQCLMFIRVLMKYLEQKDSDMYARAKVVIQECTEKNKKQDPEYLSLTVSLKRRLCATVGDMYWHKAEGYLTQVLRQQRHAAIPNKKLMQILFQRLREKLNHKQQHPPPQDNAQQQTTASQDIAHDEAKRKNLRNKPLATKTTPNKGKRMTGAMEEGALTSSLFSHKKQYEVDKIEKCNTEAKYTKKLSESSKKLSVSSKKSPFISPSRERKKVTSTP